MVIGTALGWSDVATILLAIVLAFFFGYTLTLIPLLKHLKFKQSLSLAFAVAVIVTFPVNMYLISKGKGHVVIHEHH